MKSLDCFDFHFPSCWRMNIFLRYFLAAVSSFYLRTLLRYRAQYLNEPFVHLFFQIFKYSAYLPFVKSNSQKFFPFCELLCDSTDCFFSYVKVFSFMKCHLSMVDLNCYVNVVIFRKLLPPAVSYSILPMFFPTSFSVLVEVFDSFEVRFNVR